MLDDEVMPVDDLAKESMTRQEFLREVQQMAGSGISVKYAQICEREDDGPIALYQAHSEQQEPRPRFKSWVVRDPHLSIHCTQKPHLFELSMPQQLEDPKILMTFASSFRYSDSPLCEIHEHGQDLLKMM